MTRTAWLGGWCLLGGGAAAWLLPESHSWACVAMAGGGLLLGLLGRRDPGNGPTGRGEIQEAILRERDRIAQELHSYASQTMANALFLLNLYEKDRHQEDLDGVRHAVKDVVREIRATIHDLRNEGAWPLLPSVYDCVNKFKKSCDIPVEVKVNPGEEELPSALKRHLILVIDEGLTNIAKHAAATAVKLDLQVVEGVAHVGIRDNGRGFPVRERVAEVRDRHHFGLKFIREKTEILGGAFQLESAPGRGTELLVHIPLERTARWSGPLPAEQFADPDIMKARGRG